MHDWSAGNSDNWPACDYTAKLVTFSASESEEVQVVDLLLEMLTQHFLLLIF